MPYLQRFINWYFAPWLRVGRGTFNIVMLVATLPGLFFGMGHLAGMFSPMLDAMATLHNLSGGTGGAGLTGASDTLQQMNRISAALESGGQAVAGSNWQSWLNLLVMGTLTPLFMGRARDIGLSQAKVWAATALAQSTLLTDFLGLISLPTGLGWLTGLASFITILWLCLKKSKPREPKFPVDETINPHNWPPAPYA